MLNWLGFFFPLVSPPQMWGLLTCSAHHCQKIEDCFLLACSSCKGDTIEQCSFLLVPHFGECSLFVTVRKPLNLAICACDNLISYASLMLSLCLHVDMDHLSCALLIFYATLQVWRMLVQELFRVRHWQELIIVRK